MGKATKRKDGRYVTTFTVNGKRIAAYGKTRRECLANAEHKKQDIINNMADNAPHNIGELLDKWIVKLDGKRKDTTVDGYKQVIRDHLKPAIGLHTPQGLTPDHVQALIDKLLSTHKSNTIRNIIAPLQGALEYAMARRWATYNAARLVELPPIAKSLVVPLTPEQATALLAVVRGHPMELLYYMAFILGMRKGELLAIRWEDVDIPRKVLYVTGTLRRVRGALTRTTPKTQNSHNTMPLPDAIISRLPKRHRASGYLFRTRYGNPIDTRAFERQFRVFARRANLPDTVTFHTIRHSTASFMIANGAHPRAVMEHLRHSQIAVTMNIYGHLMDDARRRETEKIADMFT